MWECLAVLVALDRWSTRWNDARINLQVRSDNVTALTTLVMMRPGSPNIAIIAREIGLRLVEFSFPPDAMHTPGIAHILSRTTYLGSMLTEGLGMSSVTVIEPSLMPSLRTHPPGRLRGTRPTMGPHLW